ncbi:hypothetical protein BHE74_00039404 [Ensete ventricosum]|nr:hypothetical protein BHE74_00039404 [Ensete ventricosum]
MEYARWLTERCKLMSALRSALQAHPPEGNLGVMVDQCLRHYDELFQLKATVAKADVFHLLNGTWKTPAERCFLWMGGFRPSELLNILIPKLDPLEQHLVWICNLKHSSEQAEEALSLGLGQLHQSLAQTIAGRSLCDGIGDGDYMNLMAAALGKLADFEEFVSQVFTTVGGLQVQTRSQTVGAAHEERGSEQDKREVGYSPRVEDAQSGEPTGKRSYKERLLTVETYLDVLEVSLEELY